MMRLINPKLGFDCARLPSIAFSGLGYELRKELFVDCYVFGLFVGNIINVANRVDWAYRFTQAASNALRGIDVIHKRPLVNAIDRANWDTTSVLHVDARRQDYEGHQCGPGGSMVKSLSIPAPFSRQRPVRLPWNPLMSARQPTREDEPIGPLTPAYRLCA